METKELLPEYVLQHHAISRAMYRLSATARKLIAVGMAILPPDLSSLNAMFSVLEYCKSLGLDPPGGETYHRIEEAVRECMKAEIRIDTPDGWQMFTWISFAAYNHNTHCLTLEFSKGLVTYVRDLKRMYARIDLIDMGKLQSLYAIRLFELAKSYESLAGAQGNQQDCWYFERTIEDLRKIFGINVEKYKLTRDFRIFVIEKPIKELNNANLGFMISPEYIKKGRNLIAVRLLCERNIRKVGKKQQKGVPVAAPAPMEPPETLEEQALAHLVKVYPQEYAQLYRELINHPPNKLFQDMPHLWEKQAQREAQKLLRDRHGVRK